LALSWGLLSALEYSVLVSETLWLECLWVLLRALLKELSWSLWEQQTAIVTGSLWELLSESLWVLLSERAWVLLLAQLLVQLLGCW
jgi:hypothetical protein